MSREWRASKIIKQAAISLRRDQTPAEQRIWSALRRKQLDGLRFRRQHPVGRFILDFYCAEHRLVVEVDGDTHASKTEYDMERSAWLEAHGYHVLRFANSDVRENLEGVLESILNFVAADLG